MAIESSSKWNINEMVDHHMMIMIKILWSSSDNPEKLWRLWMHCTLNRSTVHSNSVTNVNNIVIYQQHCNDLVVIMINMWDGQASGQIENGCRSLYCTRSLTQVVNISQLNSQCKMMMRMRMRIMWWWWYWTIIIITIMKTKTDVNFCSFLWLWRFADRCFPNKRHPWNRNVSFLSVPPSPPPKLTNSSLLG